MIAEIVGTKKRILVLACVVLSLLVHLTPLRIHLYSLKFFNVGRVDSEQVFDIRPPITITRTIKPLMMTKQLPRKLSVPSMYETRPVSENIPVEQPVSQEPVQQIFGQEPLSEPVPQEQPVEQSTHKIVRAGTGFDAPMTDFAITPALAKPGAHAAKTVQNPPVQSPIEPTSQPEAPDDYLDDAESVSEAPYYDADIETPAAEDARAGEEAIFTDEEPGTLRVRRAVLEEGGAGNEVVSVHDGGRRAGYARPRGKKSSVTSSSRNHETKNKQGLDFLSRENFERMIRDQFSGDGDGVVGTEAGYEGVFHGASTISSQYGDPRYLHYNSKIYHALQQSMDVVMSGINPAYYRTVMDGITRPAGIRFALDQEGQVKFLHVARSSGNVRYDILATKIVQEASFPSIPKSFGFHTTYHNYNILLYDVGPGPHANIGVAPYLEGE